MSRTKTALLAAPVLATALAAAPVLAQASGPADGHEEGATPPPAAGAPSAEDPADHALVRERAPETALVIHGGAGSIRELDMSDEQERVYRETMEEALAAGTDVLDGGGSSLEACVRAIRVMEDSPEFNAGVGAVLTSEGTVEHDASIMDGRSLNAGAVAGVQRLRSPIAAARLVMDSSRHVMLAQEGAETFAREHGFEMVENETFITQERRERWERRHEEASGPRASVGRSGPGRNGPSQAARATEVVPRTGFDHLGTVGCAALDRDGDLAAGTSTGGISDKRFGRIGDSPVIGAGTYADNETAALSATGHGEDFIRLGVTHEVVSMMRYGGLSLSAAAAGVIHGRLEELGPQARGGLIGLDADGEVIATFNTPGMFRAWVDTDGETVVEFYGE